VRSGCLQRSTVNFRFDASFCNVVLVASKIGLPRKKCERPRCTRLTTARVDSAAHTALIHVVVDHTVKLPAGIVIVSVAVGPFGDESAAASHHITHKDRIDEH